MIPVVISFFLGILTLHSFSTLPSAELVIIVMALLTTLIIAFAFKEFQRFRKNCGFLKGILHAFNGMNLWIKLIWFFGFGFFWCFFHAKQVLDKKLPDALEQKNIEVVGVVDSIPVMQEKGIQFEFKIRQTMPRYLWSSPGRVRIQALHPQNAVPIRVGETWQLWVKLKKPHAYANPGSMDIEKQFFQKGMVAKGYMIPGKPYRRIKTAGISGFLKTLRAALQEKIGYALEGKLFKGIIQALVVGMQDEITVPQWEIFRTTGTSHLMAISGLHIGLVAGSVFWVASRLYRYLPIQYLVFPVTLIGAISGWVAAISYSFLAGFSIPTQRAMVMVSVVTMAILRKRIVSKYRIYFLSLGLVLLMDPLSILLPGFWLSFGAVGILLYGMEGRLNPGGSWHRWGRAQWVVFLGLTPFSVALFEMTSIASPIANIIAIPWMSLCVAPLSLIGGLFSVVSAQVAGIFLTLAHSALSLLMSLLEWMSAWPQAAIHLTCTPVTCGLAGIGAFILLSPRGMVGRYMGFIWILPLFCMRPASVLMNTAKVTILDVGQGLSAVVQTAHHVLVFDTGPKLSPHFDTGNRVVLPFLATRGVKRINAIVISHNDNDHAGGLSSIMQNIPVDEIISSRPETLTPIGRNVMSCVAGQRWEWDGVRFSMLHPSGFLTKKNDHACVLKVEAGGHSVLLTGDIETHSENLLLKNAMNQLPSTVMLVPHHGSKTSSTLPFIQAVNPRYAIIPVGYRNTYGHPKAEVVQRYQQAGIALFNSVKHGAVEFTLGSPGELAAPSAYRLEHKRYWNE